jgi:hypothetical protein
MENVIAGSPIEPEPVPGFGYLILSDCGANPTSRIRGGQRV